MKKAAFTFSTKSSISSSHAKFDRFKLLLGDFLLQRNHKDLNKLLSNQPRVAIERSSNEGELNLEIDRGIWHGDRFDDIGLRDSDFLKRHLQSAIVQKRDLHRAGNGQRLFQQFLHDGGCLLATRHFLFPANIDARAFANLFLDFTESFRSQRRAG